MDLQTVPCENGFRAWLGAIVCVIGNGNRLYVEVVLDLIHQRLDAFAKLLHRRRVRMIDVLEFTEQIVEFGH